MTGLKVGDDFFVMVDNFLGILAAEATLAEASQHSATRNLDLMLGGIHDEQFVSHTDSEVHLGLGSGRHLHIDEADLITNKQYM